MATGTANADSRVRVEGAQAARPPAPHHNEAGRILESIRADHHVDGRARQQGNVDALFAHPPRGQAEGGSRFWNETLAPDEIDKLLTPKALKGFTQYKSASPNVPESVSPSENLIIKGNNLLTMHTLAKVYEGRVKLIYIDPPYNTENDSFTYNDTFTHSTWLTFMRSRLEIAQRLLAADGVLVMSIDQNEAFYLKVLTDEIFGRDNFIAPVTVQNNPEGRVLGKKAFATSHEYLLFYSTRKLDGGMSVTKSDAQIEKEYPLKDEDGFRYRELELRNTHREYGRSQPPPYNRENLFFPLYVAPSDGSVSLEKDEEHTEKVEPVWDDGYEGCWTWGTTKCELESDLLVGHLVKDRWKVYRKSYANNGGRTVSRKLKTIWFHKDFHTEKGQKVIDELVGKNKFRSPKPPGLIRTIVDLVTSQDSTDIVLDFFAGSGTTAQAVLELNQADGGHRQFILCEQLDYVESVTMTRVGKIAESCQSSFIYCELASANAAFAARIAAAADTAELLAIWTEMQDRAFLSYRVDLKAFTIHKAEFEALSLDEQKKVLIDVLDKNMLYVPLSELDDKTFDMSDADKALNRQFFGMVTA